MVGIRCQLKTIWGATWFFKFMYAETSIESRNHRCGVDNPSEHVVVNGIKTWWQDLEGITAFYSRGRDLNMFIGFWDWASWEREEAEEVWKGIMRGAPERPVVLSLAAHQNHWAPPELLIQTLQRLSQRIWILSPLNSILTGQQLEFPGSPVS